MVSALLPNGTDKSDEIEEHDEVIRRGIATFVSMVDSISYYDKPDYSKLCKVMKECQAAQLEIDCLISGEGEGEIKCSKVFDLGGQVSRVELTAMAPYKTMEMNFNKNRGVTPLTPIYEAPETECASSRPNPCINQETAFNRKSRVVLPHSQVYQMANTPKVSVVSSMRKVNPMKA